MPMNFLHTTLQGVAPISLPRSTVHFQRLLAGATVWVALFTSPGVGAQPLSGAGSSAAAPIYRSWSAAYAQQGGEALSYDPIGSGAGMASIRQRKVDFAASDVIDSKAQLDKEGLLMVPTVITAVVPVVNLPRVTPGQLRLTGEVIAGIYLGQITHWNAPEIQALNPTLRLPALPIQPVARSDGSGTTWNMADYLSQVSPTWKERMGVANRFDWPKGFVTAKGSSEVSKAVRATPGAIGYIDYNYVAEDGLTDAQMRNRDGEFVTVHPDSVRAAVRHSAWFSGGDFFSRLNHQPGKDSWPMTMATFVALPKVATQSDRTERALRFITWGYLHGDEIARRTRFVPLPTKVQASAYRQLSQVTDVQGRSIGTQALGELLAR